jgi:hypothetical protein
MAVDGLVLRQGAALMEAAETVGRPRRSLTPAHTQRAYVSRQGGELTWSTYR